MTFFHFLFKKRFPDVATRRELFTGSLTLPKLIAILIGISLFVMVYVTLVRINNTTLVTIPVRGGVLVEGIIGAPRAIHPLITVTDTDIALTKLVFSGLMKEQSDGTIVPDLAQSYDISPDGRTYTFTLKQNLTFSDGTPLTARDVSTTLTTLQNPTVNQQDAPYWQSLIITSPDSNTAVITLPAPDDTFLSRMTIGILSASELSEEEGAGSDLAPLGAGPFILSDITYDETGAPKQLSFKRNTRYNSEPPLLKSFSVIVYANQESLRVGLIRGEVNLTFALAPETLTDIKLPSDITTTSIESGRTIALWQLGTSELASESLRATMNRFIDRSAIISTIENGYGIVPPELPAPLSIEEAQQTLEKSGYLLTDGVLAKNRTPVTLSVATLTDPKMLQTAQTLTQSFTALGAITQVLGFDRGALTEAVQQRSLPLVLTDGSIQLPSAYTRALALYTKATILAHDKTVHGISFETLSSPLLRYADISSWHTKTQQVWPIFARVR